MNSKKKQAKQADEIIVNKTSLASQSSKKLVKKISLPPLPEKASSLQNYLNHISRFPLLTKEEEYKLAVQYYETKSPEAAEKLIHSNLRFVIKVAGQYSRFSTKIMDLIQEGNVGLTRAVQEFNPYKGARLITYAVWWIKGFIQEYLLKQHSVVRIGTNKKEKKLFYALLKEKNSLENLSQTKLLPSLAKNTNSSLKEVEGVKQRILQKDVSLDQPVKSNSEATLMDFQRDTFAFEETLSNFQQSSLLLSEIEKIKPSLKEKEKYILENRLLKSEPNTLQEIANQFGVTKEAIRQTEERLLKKLKKKLTPILKKPY